MATQGMDNKMGKITVFVEEALQDLIPGYLENRREDLAAIGEALLKGDFEAIRSMGHKMKGSGGGYGFDGITDIGRAMEEAAKMEHAEEINRQTATLKSYLERVDVVYRN